MKNKLKRATKTIGNYSHFLMEKLKEMITLLNKYDNLYKSTPMKQKRVPFPESLPPLKHEYDYPPYNYPAYVKYLRGDIDAEVVYALHGNSLYINDTKFCCGRAFLMIKPVDSDKYHKIYVPNRPCTDYFGTIEIIRSNDYKHFAFFAAQETMKLGGNLKSFFMAEEIVLLASIDAYHDGEEAVFLYYNKGQNYLYSGIVTGKRGLVNILRLTKFMSPRNFSE